MDEMLITLAVLRLDAWRRGDRSDGSRLRLATPVGKEVEVMRRVLAVVLMIVAITVFGCQKAEKPPEKPHITIPKGHVLIPEAALTVFIGQAETQMQAATAALKKRDNAGAARDVRLAAGFMKLEAATAKGDMKKAINGAVTDLERIATSLEKGENVTSSDLSAAFGRAEYALARYYGQRAAGALSAGDDKSVQQRLLATAAAIEAAVKWTGGKSTTEEKAVLAAAKSLSDRIAQGGQWTSEEGSQILAGLDAQIDKLKAEMTPVAPSGGA
jgi:hypothetical protein